MEKIKQLYLYAADGGEKAENRYAELDAYLKERQVRHIFLVCDPSISFLALDGYFAALEERLKIKVTRFSGFEPNPAYESVVEGVRLFNEGGCDQVVAVGGGSAMDVAKCVKLYARMDPSVPYLKQETGENGIPLLAVPTTAGTGSEATRYAVVYAGGEKQSITDLSIIPSVVLFDPSVLATLPDYQRKSTMLDALCHATESFWSVNATKASREISGQAVREILAAKDSYLANEPAGNKAMLLAAHKAGQAINITQTTAGHAMCYKLTSMYRLAHGHAAALCVKALWPFMQSHKDQCRDERGQAHLEQVFAELAAAYGAGTPEQAAAQFAALVDGLGLPAPADVKEEDIKVLAGSVNPVRLKNNPIIPETAQVEALYREILL